MRIGMSLENAPLTLPRWNLATPLQRPPRAYFQGAPLLLLLIVILLVGCAPGPNQAASASVPHGSIAGFWLGLWHGMIAWITFVISIFSDKVSIYEIHNNGGWYNFGFLLGVGGSIGGSSAASSRRK